MSRPTRRQFTQALALGAAAPLLAESAAEAVAPPTERPAPADPLPAAADALTALVRARYGRHLTDEQLRSIRGSVLNGQRSAERLRRVKLSNGDEPDFTFSADLP